VKVKVISLPTLTVVEGLMVNPPLVNLSEVIGEEVGVGVGDGVCVGVGDGFGVEIVLVGEGVGAIVEVGVTDGDGLTILVVTVLD